ncbi:MAG: hypothetical protein GON13_03495 [Nanoarchaeota archaeon]|nr:hypothetical protein [Nanoarchaeota archaeon]
MELTRTNLNRSRLELEKARKILINLDTLPDSSIKVYIENLLSAMNLISPVILESQRGDSASTSTTFEDLSKEILRKVALEERLYDMYFYLKNMTYKSLYRTDKGVIISNWKSSKTFSKDKLKSFYDDVEKLVVNIERVIMN